MAKQTFTTGQVLTAAEMTSLQQTAMGGGSTTAKTASYVLVAADAGTVVQMNSASATTITVNTALFAAGDSVQIQNIGAGVCTVTAGTATVSTAGSLALSQYEGGQLYFNTTSAALFFDIVQTSGMTNPMTTTGDIIYSSSGSTAARLGIGTTGQVVTVASGLPSWSTPSSGAVTLISQQTVTGSPVTTISFTSISGTYKNLRLVYNAAITSGSWDALYMRLNSDTGANYISQTSSAIQTSLVGAETVAGTYMVLNRVGQAGASSGVIVIPNYAATVLKKSVFSQGISIPAYTAGGAQLFIAGSGWNNTAAITQLDITVATGSIQWAVGSSFTLYGES